MGTQGPGRKRIPNRDKMTAEDDALNQIAREAEARLAAKRAARAEAREIRMKELERQQKEMFHSHKKYYGLDNKWGHIEQWMEDSERYSRHARRHASVSDDEEKMSVGSRGSFRPSDYSGFLGSSSRASSRASSARASPVVEERPERDFVDKGSRAASTLSAATLASLGGASSRRGSCDTSFSVETEASIRDMKDSLSEAEEKYRRAMVSNAQLHNEKSTLMFQVETLKEELSDMEELLWESRRHCEDQTKELERERQAHTVLQFQFKEMKETLRQTEDLLTEVSDLRLKSSTYSQEVSDLQEVLQWKEKKMAALERQTEISDIVRIDRDRLRDEVVRLTDLLKKHGVVVSPELSTNGETGRGEDDVSAQSATRLAEEPCHGGRESMLGPAEGSKAPQDDRKFSHWISQSLNVISTSDQTKPGAVKPVKRFDKQVMMEQPAGRTEGARKIPRNKGSEKEARRKPPDVRRDRKSLFGNEGVKKQQKKTERGSAAEMCEPRLNFNDQPFKGRSKPHRESVPANQDVLVTEMERSFVLVHRTESQDKRGDLVSPVHRTSAQKVPKSRLVPPRPVKDIILENKVIVSSIAAAVKQDALTQDKQKVDVSAVMRNERGSALKCSSAADDKDVNACRDVSCSGGEVVPDVPALGANQNKINEFITPTSADRMKENEFVDHMVELDGEGFKKEDSNIVTNLVENETVVTTIKISQSLEVHHQQTVSENLQSTINEDKVLKTKLSPNLETKPSELNVFLPAEQAIVGGMSGSPEKLENWRTSEEEPVREADQDAQRNSEQCNNQRETQKSTLSPFVPAETLKDQSVLEKTIQSMLRGFVENQGLAAEISRSFPGVQGSLSQWISDFEEIQKSVAENMVNRHDTVNKDSSVQMTGIKLTAKDEPPLMDLPERRETPEDPEGANGRSVLSKDSLEVLPQTNDASVDSRKVCKDVQDPPASENTSEVMFSIRKFKVEVNEKPAVTSIEVEEDKQSQSDFMVTSCSDFVFVESYFAEPEAESGSHLCLVSSSRNHAVNHQGGAKTNKQRETVGRSQSCSVIPVEEVVERQFKKYRTLSTNSHVGQSSKARRLLEITADEIKAMAVPELVLMNQRAGRVAEDQQSNESTGSEELEELSIGDMDSCEEVDEEAAQQPAMQQQPVMEDVDEDVKVKHLRGQKGLSLDFKKDRHRTDCKIS